MTSRFERDSAVERVGDARYRGRVDAGWNVVDEAAPNGGYLMAIATRAMAAEIDRPDPISVSARFVRPAAVDAVDVDVEVLHTGRRHVTARATMLQAGRAISYLTATFADLDRVKGPTLDARTPPDWPPVEQCVDDLSREDADGAVRAPIRLRFEHRHVPEVLGWIHGRPTGDGEIGGWIRWPDAEAIDAFGLLVVADCYPPAVFNLDLGVAPAWVPTVELTVQIRKRPAPGWLSTRLSTRSVTNGYFEEDGEFFDSDGDLVALSRQLTMFLPPPS